MAVYVPEFCEKKMAYRDGSSIKERKNTQRDVKVQDRGKKDD